MNRLRANTVPSGWSSQATAGLVLLLALVFACSDSGDEPPEVIGGNAAAAGAGAEGGAGGAGGAGGGGESGAASRAGAGGHDSTGGAPAGEVVGEACPARAEPPAPGGPSVFVAPGGSDDADGTEAAPFRSIARACKAVPGGGVVYLRGGTYTERQTATCNGSSERYVWILPHENERPVFSGRSMTAGPFDVVAVVYLSGRYVVLDGIEVVDSPATGLFCGNCEHVYVQHTTIHDIQGQGVLLVGHDITYRRSHLYNIVLRSRESKDHWTTGVSPWYVRSGVLSTNINMLDNYVHDVWGECLDALLMKGGEISGNIVHDCLSAAIYVDNAEDVLVDRNFIFATRSDMDSAVFPFGSPGIQLAIEGIYGSSAASPDQITVTNNVVIGTGNGIAFWRSDTRKDELNRYANVKIAYNVVKDVRGATLMFDAVAGSTSGNELVNNILYQGEQAGALIHDWQAWTVSNNLWPEGLPEYLASGSVAGDPKFVDPRSEARAAGFRLQDGSAARARGRSVSYVGWDFFCSERPATAPTIGMHEP